MDLINRHVSLLTLTPISKRGKTLISPIESEELRELRAALRDALAVPDGDTPPTPVTEWRSEWPLLAGFGLPGLCVPEADGGFGDRADAAATAATVLGTALHGAPFAGLVTAASVLAQTDSVIARDLVPALLDGTRTCGFAPYDERTGHAAAVLGADAVDALVLVDPRTGRTLLAADPAQWQSTGSLPGEFDRTRTVSRVTLDSGAGLELPPATDPLPLYRLLLAADALGGLERSLERTVAYSRQRLAFGRAIGGFQTVQHRLVDHTIRVRGMGLAVSRAAQLLTARSPEAERAALVAEAAVTGHAVGILHDLVQLTGGIGFTWEHGLHLFERRAQVDALLATNPRRALGDLARLEGWSG